MLQLHAKMLGGTAPAGGGKEQGHGQGGEGTGDLRVLEIHSRLSQAARTHGGMLIVPSWWCHGCCPGRPGRTRLQVWAAPRAAEAHLGRPDPIW